MTPKLKEKWVTALRSGDYKQGNRFLKGNDGCFCCLGVLCDITEPEAWEQNRDDEIWYHHATFGMPGNRVLGRLGLEYMIASRLASMNDCGSTFEEIATYIEDKVE